MKQPMSGQDKAVKPVKRDGLRKWTPKIANLFLWISFCAMSGTGLLLAFRLPPGSRGGHGLSAMGWNRHEWGDLHLWISYAFLAVILGHMALHWRWFWQIASKRRAWPMLVGVGTGLIILVGLALLPIKHEEPKKHPQPTSERGKGNGRQFQGGRE